MGRRRFLNFFRDTAVSIAVTVAVFVLVEVCFRLFSPQVGRTVSADGSSRANPDSLVGHRYHPNSSARHLTPEFSVDYVIDEHGRRQRSSAASTDPGAVRFLAIGDSFTFGDGNQEPDIWVRVAERELREKGWQIDFINAGIEGYDTRSELMLLKELEPEIHPRVVVLGFLTNDVYTNKPAQEPAAVSGGNRRAFALHVVEWAKRMAMEDDRMYARLFLLTARKGYYASAPDAHVARQIEITRDLLGEIADYCVERGITLIVVSIPQQFAVISAAREFHFDGIDPRALDVQLAPVVQARGFTWVETLPRLAATYRNHSTDLFYRVDGHLTPEGNRVLGELVASAIVAANTPR